MQKMMGLYLLGLNTFITAYNYYGILRINKYIDIIEEREGNKKLNEINQTLDKMLSKDL
jgi:hypothetical protein